MILASPDNLKIDLPLARIGALCRSYGVRELCAFGSALREDFGPESDLDLLVIFESDDTGPWAGKYYDLQESFSQLLGRRVDLVSRRAVEQSENYIRRREILESARVIFES